MKHIYIAPLAMLLAAIVSQVLTSCTAFTYSYAYYPTDDDTPQRTVVADTSRWWLKPIYIRTDTTTNRDSMEMRQFVWFHDDNEGVTYVKVSADNSILFEPRSADLNSTAMMELIYIGTLLDDKPFSELVIYGSTDNTESRDYSQELSEERAETVAEFLETMGYNPERIQAIGLGDTDPAADNNTFKGRAQNRYVDVFVTIADN